MRQSDLGLLECRGNGVGVRIRAVLVALAVVASCLAAANLAQPGIALAACARPSGTMVAYGHSYLHSPRIGGAPASYATLAASALGATPVIRAVNGDTTLDVERLVRQGPTQWVPGSAKLVVIDSAINDIGRRLPAAQWTGALRRTLNTFATAPVPTILLLRPLPVTRAGHPGRYPGVLARYAEAQRSVAAQFSAVRVVDASAGWNPRLDLSADGLHPNAAGMQHIARALEGNVQRSSCQP